MVAILSLFALATAAGLVSAAPAATCSTVTKTAGFNDMPTGTMSPSYDYKGLNFDGFEVVKSADTTFKNAKGSHILRMTGKKGVISAAKEGTLFNDYFTPSFMFGCQTSAGVAHGCSFTKLYHVPCNFYGCTAPGPTFDLLFDAKDNPHHLEEAEGAEVTDAPKVTWTVYDTPADVHLYIDSYKYYVTDC